MIKLFIVNYLPSTILACCIVIPIYWQQMFLKLGQNYFSPRDQIIIHLILIQRILMRSLGRSREGLQEQFAQGNGKQPRTRLAEKLNASRMHGIMGENFQSKRSALEPWLALPLFFPEDDWMIILRLPAFSNSWYFDWEGIPAVAQDQAGPAEGGRGILLWDDL